MAGIREANVQGKLADVPLDSLVPSIQVNLLSALYLIQPAMPYLRQSAKEGSPSRVVFISSGASGTGYQAWGMYSMNKAGLNSFARTLATEEKDSNVVFYSVRPGVVDVSCAHYSSLPSCSLQSLGRGRGRGLSS